MANVIGQGVTLSGLEVEASQVTFYGADTMDAKLDIGRAVALDTSAANKVKLAGEGDVILGYLQMVEKRALEGVTTVTVALNGGHTFDCDPASTPAIGSFIEGAALNGRNGYVQEMASGTSKWQIVEVLANGAKVVAINY